MGEKGGEPGTPARVRRGSAVVTALLHVDGKDKEGTVADVWIRYVDVPDGDPRCEVCRYRPYLVQQ